jgi:putative sterol carrier protein
VEILFLSKISAKFSTLKHLIVNVLTNSTNYTKMSDQAFFEKVRQIVGNDCGLQAKVKFDLNENGVVYVDATQVPNIVSTQDLDADCVIQLSAENAVKLAKGDLNVMTAFMLGKLKVKGDMSVAMKVAGMLGK